ncbi:hypothetical protein D3C80_1776630 [compost metagenome]
MLNINRMPRALARREKVSSQRDWSRLMIEEIAGIPTKLNVCKKSKVHTPKNKAEMYSLDLDSVSEKNRLPWAKIAKPNAILQQPIIR